MCLRATNNGVTAIVNQRGELAAQLPQFEAGVLRGQYSAGQRPDALQSVGALAGSAALSAGAGVRASGILRLR